MDKLLMRRPHLKDLPLIVVPDDYELRIYRESDERAWADIMNTGIGSDWICEKVLEKLIQMPQFIAEGLFFATREDIPVGSACVWRDNENEWRHGILHMVCVLPEHRGKRLGYWLSLAVLKWFLDNGFEDASLLTDDWRLPAIWQYLKLQFHPVISDNGMKERWVSVAKALRLDELSYFESKEDMILKKLHLE